jgi:hypothetical protein
MEEEEYPDEEDLYPDENELMYGSEEPEWAPEEWEHDYPEEYGDEEEKDWWEEDREVEEDGTVVKTKMKDSFVDKERAAPKKKLNVTLNMTIDEIYNKMGRRDQLDVEEQPYQIMEALYPVYQTVLVRSAFLQRVLNRTSLPSLQEYMEYSKKISRFFVKSVPCFLLGVLILDKNNQPSKTKFHAIVDEYATPQKLGKDDLLKYSRLWARLLLQK